VWSVRCEVGGDARKAAPAPAATPAARPKPAPATDDWPATARTGPQAPARPASAKAEPGPQDEEVPYDPEFDGPPSPTLQGFDPGDEPDLDTDSLAVRQTSEEQALESLRKNFNIEKIAEQGR
jgi:DNA polymerase-3 subunit gamma/tau